MDQAVILGLTSGASVIAGLAGGWLLGRPRNDIPDIDLDGPDLPAGVIDVLAVLRSAAVVVDVSDTVVKASPAAYAFGIVRNHDIAHIELLNLIHQVRSDGVTREREFELPRGPLGPGRVIIYSRVAPLGPLHVLLLAEDRSESRRLQESRRDFVVNVSHELKTPVGAISLLSEALQDAAEDPEAVRRFAQRMGIESQRLSTLVQEIIELSRLQVHTGIESPERVSIKAVLNEAYDRCRIVAEERNISLIIGDVETESVFGNAELLTTAIKNLIDNAVRYSDPDTKVGIGIKTTDRIIEIAVADQGIGIDSADLGRVFERFYRVDQARSRQTGGTGLGLSIVKHVIANHGGDVTVWSQPGHGSTFTVRLPLAAPEDTDPDDAARNRKGKTRDRTTESRRETS